MFELRNLQKSLKKPKNQKLAIVASSIATLVASGSTSQVVDDDNDDDTSLNKAVVVQPVLSVSNSLVQSGTEFLVNSKGTASQNNPDVAALKNGGFISVWRTTDINQDGEGSAIKAQVFNADGSPQAIEFLVNTQTIDTQLDPSVSGLNNGGFVIAWATHDGNQDGSSTAIKAQFYNPNGTANGAEILVNNVHFSAQLQITATTLENGNVVFTWLSLDNSDSNGGIKARIFNQNGQAVADEFLVNFDVVDLQQNPAVTALSNGSFVITYETSNVLQDFQGKAILAAVYTADGATINSQLLMNFETHFDQYKPSIAALADGKFIITWITNDLTGDGDGTAIKARIFKPNGTAFDDEFRVNSQADGNQINPKVVTLADGGFVIVWETDAPLQDGDGSAIKAQIYDHNFDPQGGEFLINSQTAANQLEPEIAALVDGGFVVNWVTEDVSQDGSGSAIKGQIFNYTPVYKYTTGGAYDFDITAELHDFQTDATLSDITITDIPNGVTFNNGVQNGDTLTLTQADLAGLEMTLGASTGQFELTISVTSTANGQGGEVITTTLHVPLSIGNLILGDGGNNVNMVATAETEHFYGLDGVDIVTFAGNKAEYSFALVGNDLQVTHTVDDTTNVDLLHSIEGIAFADIEAFTIQYLDDLGDITSLTGDAYDHWLTHSYNIYS